MKNSLHLFVCFMLSFLLGGYASVVSGAELAAPDWGGLLLKSLKITKSNKTDKVTFSYDEKNRLTKLVCESDYGSVKTYNFSYTENKMNMKEAGGGYDVTLNVTDGHVVSGTMSSLDYSGASAVFDYDNNGHLNTYTFSLGNRSMVTQFNWSGNDIVSVKNADGSDCTFTYTDKIAPPMLQKLIFGELGGAISINNVALSVCVMLYMDHGMCDKLVSTMNVTKSNGSKTYNYTYNYNDKGQISSFDVDNAHHELEWETYSSTTTPVDKPTFNSSSTLEGQNIYYDLQGRRVEKPAKGIYIIGGNKVVLQ